MDATVKSPGYNYGSVAYDYARPMPYNEGADIPARRQVVIPAPPKTREKAETAARAVPKQAVAPFAIIGTACCAIMLIFTLMAKIQLTEITNQSAQLEQQLSQLKVSQDRILINYEKAFNLTEIEGYATSTLGMQRPRDEQVFYLDNSVPDKAVIIKDKANKDGLGERIINTLKSVGEYFK